MIANRWKGRHGCRDRRHRGDDLKTMRQFSHTFERALRKSWWDELQRHPAALAEYRRRRLWNCVMGGVFLLMVVISMGFSTKSGGAFRGLNRAELPTMLMAFVGYLGTWIALVAVPAVTVSYLHLGNLRCARGIEFIRRDTWRRLVRFGVWYSVLFAVMLAALLWRFATVPRLLSVGLIGGLLFAVSSSVPALLWLGMFGRLRRVRPPLQVGLRLSRAGMSSPIKVFGVYLLLAGFVLGPMVVWFQEPLSFMRPYLQQYIDLFPASHVTAAMPRLLQGGAPSAFEWMIGFFSAMASIALGRRLCTSLEYDDAIRDEESEREPSAKEADEESVRTSFRENFQSPGTWRDNWIGRFLFGGLTEQQLRMVDVSMGMEPILRPGQWIKLFTLWGVVVACFWFTNSTFWVVFLGGLSLMALAALPMLYVGKVCLLMLYFRSGLLPGSRVDLLRGTIGVGYRIAFLLLPFSLVAGSAIFYFDRTGTYSHLVLFPGLGACLTGIVLAPVLGVLVLAGSSGWMHLYAWKGFIRLMSAGGVVVVITAAVVYVTRQWNTHLALPAFFLGIGIAARLLQRWIGLLLSNYSTEDRV